MFRCFSQRLAGGWYGGGLGPGVDKDCKKEDRINTGWPCYTEERPTVSCSGKYWNDYLYKKVSKDKTRIVIGCGYLIIVFKHEGCVFPIRRVN